MDRSSLGVVRDGREEECRMFLSDFNIEHEQDRAFCDISSDVKLELWDAIFERIKHEVTSPELIRVCLNTLRLLSRDKITLENVINEDKVLVVMKLANLVNSGECTESLPNECGYEETLEALKVLFNMFFQSGIVRGMAVNQGVLEGLLAQCAIFYRPDIPSAVKFFSLRAFFIITALFRETRSRVRTELNGVDILLNYLEPFANKHEAFDDETSDIISEGLKVLYNFIHDMVRNKNNPMAEKYDDAERLIGDRVVKLVQKLLVKKCSSKAKEMEVISHSIDLLAAVPAPCFKGLITPESQDSAVIFEGHDLSALHEIVKFLESRLQAGESMEITLSETLSPILCILIRMGSGTRIARRYLKHKILPPLKKADLETLPEVGDSLRNRMCAVLTSSSSDVAELSAQLLFILCKENVYKMVKYTGYGNAAGLLAKRGLLLGGSGNTSQYSSDSESSDTEEYQKVQHLINEVEGRIPPVRSDPCAGMTEEQKEEEAVKLVNAIDRLQRTGFLQPCRISEDGRPQPIEHVSQLQEELENPVSYTKTAKLKMDSDSE